MQLYQEMVLRKCHTKNLLWGASD
ncbi:MAG: hypothetical protein RLZZ176_2448, partial [Cyanobacteriota bacterium]